MEYGSCHLKHFRVKIWVKKLINNFEFKNRLKVFEVKTLDVGNT